MFKKFLNWLGVHEEHRVTSSYFVDELARLNRNVDTLSKAVSILQTQALNWTSADVMRMVAAQRTRITALEDAAHGQGHSQGSSAHGDARDGQALGGHADAPAPAETQAPTDHPHGRTSSGGVSASLPARPDWNAADPFADRP